MIGIDLVHISKFVAVVESKRGAHSLRMIFSDAEMLESGGDGIVSMRSLAGRFAIKEAIIKASSLDLGLDDMLRIRIMESASGRLYAVAEKVGFAPERFCVTLSHDGDYAIAVVIRE